MDFFDRTGKIAIGSRLRMLTDAVTVSYTHLQDATSRHRGAKPRRRYELLGVISLLSLRYLLSVERRQFHFLPQDHLGLLSHLLDLLVSQLGLSLIHI